MRRRRFWEDEYRGGISPDWVVAGIVTLILLAGVLGFWFNDMYQHHYGLFATL